MDKDDVKLFVGVKVFLQNEEGKFLLLKRAEPYEGESECKWDIPGGRINPGEELFSALRREVMEETGLGLLAIDRILDCQDILIVAGKHTVRITYLGRVNPGRIMLDPAEHTQYRWLTLEEVKLTFHDKFLDPILMKLNP